MRPLCLRPWRELLLLDCGNVLHCCWQSIRWGNINQMSVDELINGEAPRRIRRALLAGEFPPECQPGKAGPCPEQGRQ